MSVAVHQTETGACGVVTAPRTTGVSEGARCGTSCEHKGSIIGVDSEKGIVRCFSVEFGVKATTPETNLRALLKTFRHLEGILANIESAFPLVVGNGVLVVVVPHAVDALFGKPLDAVVPPLVASGRSKVDVASIISLAAACTPELCDGWLLGVGIDE
ncbi:hypothetical protein HG530_001688 [Fusarium avenaceum]|nr:hypothetical protein HG530_001688 [Fusarium avenaceum]